MGLFSWIKSIILGTNEVVPTKKYNEREYWNKPIISNYPSNSPVSKKKVSHRSASPTQSNAVRSDTPYCASNDLLNPLNPLSPISPFSVWHNHGGEDKKDVPNNDGHKGCHHGHSHNHTDNAGSSNHSHHSHQSDYGSSHSSDHHTSYDSGSSSYDSGSSDSGGSSDCGGGSSD